MMKVDEWSDRGREDNTISGSPKARQDRKNHYDDRNADRGICGRRDMK
jgi:hypothetical protein